MKFKYFILFIFSTFSYTSYSQGNFRLVGDFTPCEVGCYSYSFDSETPIYELQITNILEPSPESHNIEYIWSQDSQSFIICYELTGTYVFYYELFLDQETYQDTFTVEVGQGIPIEIFDLNPCSTNPDKAFQACKGGISEYTTDDFNNSNGNIGGTWVVTGASSYITNSDNSITVTWGEDYLGTLEYITFAPVGCESSQIVNVELLDGPVSQFSFENAKDKYCLAEDIILINESQEAGQFLWNFGNGTTSTDVQPTVSYDTPGDYLITLTAFNDCGCEDIYSLEIKIDEAWMPQIDCKGTICENNTVTYTSIDDCGVFDWSISSNGTIVSGGGNNENFITVDWGNGPEGYIDLEVQSCNMDVCPTPASFLIPIVSDNAPIKGNLTPCIGSTESYAITDFGATNYQWSVTGGIILAGQNSHAVMVKWNSSTTGDLAVSYNNCYLECGGATQAAVTITEKFGLSGDNKICMKEEISVLANEVTSTSAALVDWTLYDDQGVTVNSQSSLSNYKYTDNSLEGLHTLIANTNNYCNESDTFNIYLTPLTDLPDSILGELSICTGAIYEYEASSSVANPSFKWEISDGTTITEQEGKHITYTWTSGGPYGLSLSQKDNNGDWCYSEYLVQNLDQVTSLQISGDTEVCPDELSTYVASEYKGLTYDWSIVPQNAGTIISGQGAQEIVVQWANSGLQTLQLNVCGISESIVINVLDKPMISLDYEEKVCYNLTTTVTTSIVFEDYKWYNETENLIDQTPNPDLFPGTYLVEVIDDRGCTQFENFTIIELPKPEINISTPDFTTVCLANSPTLPTLHAVVSSGGYTYDWQQENISIGNDNPKLITSTLGRYNVQVTDQNGCTAVSNTIEIDECCTDCGGSGPSNVCETDNGLVAFDVLSTPDCSTFRFDNQSQNVLPGSYRWNFGDGISDDVNPIHEFSKAAFYKVFLSGSVEDKNNPGDYCSLYDFEAVISPMKAFFSASLGCPGAPVEFTDRSVSLPDYTITTYQWNFDDPTSSDNTSSAINPMHTYTAAGSYNVQLVIGDGSCTDTLIQEVKVYELPTATIELTESRCEDIAGKFDLVASNGVVRANWTFDDASSGIKNSSAALPSYHLYESPDLYDVSVAMENIYGCVSTTNASITIHQNDLSGNIISSNGPAICEASTTDLETNITGATKWEWQDGSTIAQITVENEGIYMVTVTDDNLCTYSPGHFILDVIEAPKVSVYAETFTDSNLEIKTDPIPTFCEGEDFRLIATFESDYTYTWSNASSGNILTFSNDLGNLPAPGTYSYGLTITDNASGCSHVNPDFTIEIIPGPGSLTVKTTTNGILCGSENHNLYVENPSSGIDYYWNTGLKSSSIETTGGGAYFVVASNTNGCASESNVITIAAGPDMDQVPSGCFIRCNPDTICMPEITGAATYQWYLDGIAVDATDNGNVPEVIAKTSGSYELVVTDNIGCSNTSLPLVLTLQDAIGVLQGKLYVDVNDNGIIDNADTVKASVPMILSNGQSITTDANGCFMISNLDANLYNVKADTTGLGGYDNALPQIDFSIVTCDDTASVEVLLIKNCIPGRLADRNESICKGNILTIDGIDYVQPGEYIVYENNAAGCQDSFKLTLDLLPSSQLADQVEDLCQGSSITINGSQYSSAGEYIIYVPNLSGCQDSFNLEINLISQQQLADKDQHLCIGETVIVEGEQYSAAGQYIVYTPNTFGCTDSFYLNITQSQEAMLDIEIESPCDGSSNGSIICTNPTGLGDYTYKLDNSSTNTDGLFTGIGEGTYELSILDQAGCEVAQEIVMVDPRPELEYELVDTEWDCNLAIWSPKVNILSTQQAGITIEWSNGTNGAIANINESGWHSVTVSNDCESVTEEFLNEREYKYFSIEMPNIFSPNGDGVNENFNAVLDQLNDPLVTYFVISDRMGKVVYIYNKDTSAEAIWDGRYPSGETLPIGVYFYKMEYEHTVCDKRRKETLTGDVTIVR